MFLERGVGWWTLFLLLTLAGGWLRFWRLGQQYYWTDEVSTIRRIKGSFDFLLSSLSDQGFPPGWYVLLRGWCIGVEHFFPAAHAFGPGVTRIIPALLGTAMIPTMYFLARQFTDRRGSFLVMLLTAANPYLIYYSRDIKMYGAMWLFATLNLAIFLRWQTTHKHLRWWLLFALSGALATAMQSMAWVLIGLQLLFLLTRPRLKAFDGPLWILGIGVMALLPTYWYLNRTNWVDRMIENGDGGLAWVDRYTTMEPSTIASLPTAHLLGFLWPEYPLHVKEDPNERIRSWFELGTDFDDHAATRYWPWVAHGELYAGMGLLALLGVGLIPWRKRDRLRIAHPSLAVPTFQLTAHRWWWIPLWIGVPTMILLFTWIPETSPWHARIWGTMNPRHVWEPRYLGIAVPAFILWLAVCIRRLPTWPLRFLVGAMVLAVCLTSAGSNYFFYRNAPLHVQAELVAEAVKKDSPGAVMFVEPIYPFARDHDILALDLALGHRPAMQFQPNPPLPLINMLRNRVLPQQYVAAAAMARSKDSIHTLIMTDRYGDVTDAGSPLSDASIGQALGSNWKLASSVTYQWHYEWRYYFFNTWRTRVWERLAPNPPSPHPPTSATRRAATHPAK